MFEKQPTGIIDIDNIDDVRFEKMSKADIDQVLKIQEGRSLSAVLKKFDGNKDEVERNDFLVHLLSKAEIAEILDKPNGIETIVCKEGDKIVGYAIGYDLGLWRELNPDWTAGLDFNSGADESEILNEAMYFRHVNTAPDAKAGTGKKISLQLVNQAKEKGFKKVFGEILQEPFINKPSTLIHKRIGFKEVATIKEDHPDYGELTWELMGVGVGE